MKFSTTWYRRPAKAQIRLRIRAVWSEPLLIAWIIYNSLATDLTAFRVSSLKGGCTGSSESTLVKCHIAGNHMSRIIYHKNHFLMCWLKNEHFFSCQIYPCLAHVASTQGVNSVTVRGDSL